MLLDFKKWHPTFSEKHMKTFFWMSYQKNVFMIFVEKFCRESPTKLFGQVWLNSGKNPSRLQKFACSKPTYIYKFSNQIWMVFRHKGNRKRF